MSVRRSAGGVWIEKRKKKDMSLILCIETGTDICSVGLARDGELISLRESDQGRDHARQVGVFVDELLSQTGIAPEELESYRTFILRDLKEISAFPVTIPQTLGAHHFRIH